jgi:hypothetical protein
MGLCANSAIHQFNNGRSLVLRVLTAIETSSTFHPPFISDDLLSWFCGGNGCFRTDERHGFFNWIRLWQTLTRRALGNCQFSPAGGASDLILAALVLKQLTAVATSKLHCIFPLRFVKGVSSSHRHRSYFSWVGVVKDFHSILLIALPQCLFVSALA